jgi:hypothetical protein
LPDGLFTESLSKKEGRSGICPQGLKLRLFSVECGLYSEFAPLVCGFRKLCAAGGQPKARTLNSFAAVTRNRKLPKY